jgi:hypothetical protein
MSPAFLAILIPAIFALIVFLVFRQAKRQQKALGHALRRHGFAPLEQLADTELDTVRELRRVTKETIGVKKVYEYRHLEYRLLRFDITSRSSEGHDSTVYAVIDSRLALPRFSIAPNIKLPGFLNSLWGKLLEKIMSRAGLSEVKLPGSPEFAKKYILLAGGDAAMVKDISRSLWDRVAGLAHHVMLDAKGDMLLYQKLQLPTDRGRRPARTGIDDDIRTHLELGEQLHAIFQDAFTRAPAAPVFRPR